MTPSNLFENVPEGLPEEFFQEILNRSCGHIKIERIVSRGHHSPEGFWYDQAWDEWVLVVRGRAGLEFEGRAGVVELGPGDHLLIEAHYRHRVAWSDESRDTVWLAVHIQSPSDL